jgi:hypothetical protein
MNEAADVQGLFIPTFQGGPVMTDADFANAR